MRNFAYVNPDFEQDSTVLELVEGNPCYEPSAYDSVMLEELSDGSYMYMDMKCKCGSVIPEVRVNMGYSECVGCEVLS